MTRATEAHRNEIKLGKKESQVYAEHLLFSCRSCEESNMVRKKCGRAVIMQSKVDGLMFNSNRFGGPDMWTKAMKDSKESKGIEEHSGNKFGGQAEAMISK